MSSEVFRRVGRGGAGNFYSKKDIEDAEKAHQQQDLEAQKPKSPPSDAAAATVPAAHHTAPTYTRAGRGGAGNFQDAPTITDSIYQEDVLQRTKAAVSASLAKPRAGGLSGRGGVGNWSDDTARREREDEDRRRQQEIETRIAHDVEASLQMPGKTYHQHDREME